jgi:hypothetical protein
MTDFRAELQRLVEAYEEHGGKWPDHHEQALFQAIEDARAALAQPEPVVPTDEDRPMPAAIRDMPEQQQRWYALGWRAALTRYGAPANIIREENLDD